MDQPAYLSDFQPEPHQQNLSPAYFGSQHSFQTQPTAPLIPLTLGPTFLGQPPHQFNNNQFPGNQSGNILLANCYSFLNISLGSTSFPRQLPRSFNNNPALMSDFGHAAGNLRGNTPLANHFLLLITFLGSSSFPGQPPYPFPFNNSASMSNLGEVAGRQLGKIPFTIGKPFSTSNQHP